MTDDLTRRAQTGDTTAFTTLLRECDGRMRGLACRLLGSQSAMDDALQDAYLKAYGRLDSFDGRAAFSTWLYTIVYRTCLDHLRSHRRRLEVGLEALGEPEAEAADHADRHADADILDRALRRLPPDQVAVVLLVEVDGCSYHETAALLGVSEGTVSSRVTRARQAFRDALIDKGSRR